MPLSNTERSKLFRARRKEEGGKQFTLWLPADVARVVAAESKRRGVGESAVILGCVREVLIASEDSLPNE
ncbi:MAG: hypothetical protein HOL04_04010 [Gammaproteobacteria bacterium]|jgi:hypothetical protein|nr:hypothetical protein [Gammaproteobacteria bacterium]MBT4811624.1 hypothetical protein [Thiotrichales bacterium]MBT5360887.1 hypothetical protein [Gammaproteobacteria bacterium]MBT5634472.1 hypothetical protein [Gammaproteobacteria bacterium]MBT7023840.1 hypothetical protein [Gammaproteobacteria bacterium]